MKELTAVFIATVNTKQTFTGFRALAEWLGCYHYRVPTDRFASDKLTVLLFNYLMKRHAGEAKFACYLLSSYVSILDCNIPNDIQHELINYYETKSANI